MFKLKTVLLLLIVPPLLLGSYAVAGYDLLRPRTTTVVQQVASSQPQVVAKAFLVNAALNDEVGYRSISCHTVSADELTASVQCTVRFEGGGRQVFSMVFTKTLWQLTGGSHP